MYRQQTSILAIGLLALGFLSVICIDRAFCLMTVVTLFAFVTQMGLLIGFARNEQATVPDSTIFWTVLVYCLILALLYFALSYLYGGPRMLLFTDSDAQLYYREGIKSGDLGALENARRIVRRFDFDDWGALLFCNFFLYFFPSPYAMNVFYLLTGAVSSVLLFRIGKRFMPDCHAALAALAYGTSSYMVLFHCTFLKESIFVFLVILALYCFFKAVYDDKMHAWIGLVLCTISIVFFRSAVAAFLLVALAAYYAITKRGQAVSVILYMMIGVGLIVSYSFLQGQVDTYTGGDGMDVVLSENTSENYSSSFNFFVGGFSSLFGPFPTLFPPKDSPPTLMHFYAAGLLYKLFLVLPFWLGIFYVVKNRETMMIPIVVFILAEMAAAAVIMASFELRKVLLHIPFTYIVSFYGIYQLGKSRKHDSFKTLFEFVSYAFALGIIILWTIVRVK